MKRKRSILDKDRRSLVLGFIIIGAAFLVMSSCLKRETKWDGTIETQNGVTIVENDGRPIYEEGVFSLTEEMSLENGEGSEDLFSSIVDFDVDAEGSIYILDQREGRVRIFDKNGRPVKSFGKKGQGPGEFQVPIFLEISPSGRLLCFDPLASRLLSFSMTGDFLEQIFYSKTRAFGPSHIDSRGNLIGRAVLAPEPIGGQILQIMSPDGSRVLDVFKVASDLSKRGKREFDVGKPRLCFSFDRLDHVYWGYADTYEIRVIDAQGALLRVIRNRSPRLAISSEDKIVLEKFYAATVQAGFKLVFREYFPFFDSISIDAQNRMFVKTMEKGRRFPDRCYYDIYDPDGRYLAKVLIPANLNEMSIWSGDKLYTRETDADGIEKIVRYRVSWNLR